MTSRTINRSLIIHNDLALGAGQTIQTRGTETLSEQKIELDFIFREANEIRYLDVLRYTRASIHTAGPLIHYVYDPTSAAIDDGNLVLAPIPTIPVGRWLRVTSGGSGGSNYSYATVAELIADTTVIETVAPGAQVAVSGYHMAGDFGGGAFYWDPLSTDSHDGGMVLTPNGRTDPGRWHRIIATKLSVHHFGAVGDNVTNDRTAIEAALTAGALYKLIIEFRDLSYNVAGLDITIVGDIQIQGNGFSNLYNGVQITFANEYVGMHRIGIVDWSGGINLAPPGSPIGEATYNFEAFSAVRCAYGIRSLDPNAITATLRVRGGFFEGPQVRQCYYFEGKVAVVDIENIKIKEIGNTSDNIPTYGIALGVTTNDCDTVLIRNCEITGLISNTDINCFAIYVKGSKTTVTDNIITNINGAGEGKRAIYVVGESCVITNNVITNGGESTNGGWIRCESSNDDNNFIVSNNILDATTGKLGMAMYLAGVGTVNGNRISGDSIERVITLVGQPAFQQFHITSNYIDCPAARYGLLCVELNSSIIDDNHIKVNLIAIESQVPSATYAIQNTIFSNNYLEASTGIKFTEAQKVRLDNNIFETTTELLGNYKYSWWFIDGVMSTTSAKLLAIGDIVNIMPYKQIGVMIWDETLGKPLYAAGNAAGSLWVDSAGTTVHTPS